MASFTIPSVITNYQHTQYITSLKKAQSILSSATSMYIAQGGTITGDVNGDGKINAIDLGQIKQEHLGIRTLDSFEEIKANLQIISMNKNLDDIVIYDINGKSQDVTDMDYRGSSFLKDGMSIKLNLSSAVIKKVLPESFPLMAIVDVNGPFKKPNKLGIDVFSFIVSTKGQIIPAGADLIDFKDGTKYKTLDGDKCILTNSADVKSVCATSSALSGKNPDGTDYWKGIKYWEYNHEE